MILKDIWFPIVVTLRRWFSHATEPHILFPAIAVVVLAGIWGTTLNLISVERTITEHAEAVSSPRIGRNL